MFSQVFNRAKGIFSKKELPASASNDSSGTAQASSSESANKTDSPKSKISEMVVTTRQKSAASPKTNGTESAANGKRKTRETSSRYNNADNKSGQSSKRRRISSETKESDLIQELSSSKPVPEDNGAVEAMLGFTGNKPEIVSSTNPHQDKPNNRIRFDSEEPALSIRTAEAIKDPQPAAVVVDSEDSDSDADDDDAPEVVANSAQLMSLKVQAQKQKEAKKRDQILQKEKRRLHDKKHKSQAKALVNAKADKEPKVTSQQQSIDTKLISDDDIVSESTATLQGSVVKESSGRRVLPALLPDEILNAEPEYRLPSPPPEKEQPKDTRQHKFFQDVEKPAKDIHRGDVTIRVLDDNKVMLPPKSSRIGRNIKTSWMAGRRSRHAPAGLKRVGGGPKSFVRR